jgi:hypothetical protein
MRLQSLGDNRKQAPVTITAIHNTVGQDIELLQPNAHRSFQQTGGLAPAALFQEKRGGHWKNLLAVRRQVASNPVASIDVTLSLIHENCD